MFHCLRAARLLIRMLCELHKLTQQLTRGCGRVHVADTSLKRHHKGRSGDDFYAYSMSISSISVVCSVVRWRISAMQQKLS